VGERGNVVQNGLDGIGEGKGLKSVASQHLPSQESVVPWQE